MKTVQNLLASKGDKRIGNHKREDSFGLEYYIYHQTAICIVNRKTNKFTTQNGGFKTSSTTRAISSYKKELNSIGYEEVGSIKELK
jgi:hypothetical protein